MTGPLGRSRVRPAHHRPGTPGRRPTLLGPPPRSEDPYGAPPLPCPGPAARSTGRRTHHPAGRPGPAQGPRRPAALVDAFVVTEDNIKDTVIKDKLYKVSEIC
ncbi:hypothetical protein EQK42_08175, partial [Streptomyces albidoflavus]